MTQTPKLIQETFVKLALEKPVDKITVREIVDICGINRNSFYYYYEDLPDLIVSILDEAIVSEAKAHAGESYGELCVAIAKALQDNVGFCRNLYFSKNKEVLSVRLGKTINLILGEYLMQGTLASSRISDEDREIILQIYRMEVIGMIREWMQIGMSFDLQKRVARIAELREGSHELMLKHAEDSTKARSRLSRHTR